MMTMMIMITIIMMILKISFQVPRLSGLSLHDNDDHNYDNHDNDDHDYDDHDHDDPLIDLIISGSPSLWPWPPCPPHPSKCLQVSLKYFDYLTILT